MTRLSLKWLKEYNLLIYEEVDSTNSEAIRLAKAGVEGNFVVWAHDQIAGRGSRGRSWTSGQDNLYMSILISHEHSVNILPQLSFVTAIAIYDALTFSLKKQQNLVNKLTITPFDIKLKWPNDILINDAKVAGVLLESIYIPIFKRNYIIIGVGVNVNNAPVINGRKITSLRETTGQEIDTSYIFDKILTYFDSHYKKWQTDGFFSIRKAWLKKAYKINNVITVDSGHNRVSGIFKDIDFNGAIRIKLACGRIYSLQAGDVML